MTSLELSNSLRSVIKYFQNWLPNLPFTEGDLIRITFRRENKEDYYMYMLVQDIHMVSVTESYVRLQVSGSKFNPKTKNILSEIGYFSFESWDPSSRGDKYKYPWDSYEVDVVNDLLI